MPKSVKSTIFLIIVLAATCSTVYLLNQLDQIVRGQLYEVQFNLDWANAYWNIFTIIQILLGVASAATAISLVLTIKRDVLSKKPTERSTITQRPQKTTPYMPAMPRAVERQTTPPLSPRAGLNAPTMKPTAPPTQPSPVAPVVPAAPAPKPQQFSAETSGPIGCPHCGKAFTQPLRMLDFQSDRPRIVNICPFCNEIIQTTPKQESQEDGKFFLRRRNNHTSKTAAPQPTG